MNSSNNSIKTQVGLMQSEDQNQEFFALLDKHNRIVKTSDSFKKMTGWEEGQVKGRNFYEFIENIEGHELDLDASSEQNLKVKADLRTKLSASKTFELEFNRIKANETLLVAKSKNNKLIPNADLEMEELLLLFVKNSPAALAMLDINMNYIITSDRWIKDYNLDIKDLNGLNHYDVFKGIPDRWKQIHARCLQGEVEKSEEDYFYDNEGKLVWNKWEIHPWYKNNGEIGGIIMFTEVITQVKEAEMKFSDLTKNPLVGVFILQDKRLVFTNSSISDTIGYSDDELRSMDNVLELLAEVEQDQINQMIENVMSGESGEMYIEFKCFKKDGTSIWAELYGSRTIYGSRPAMIGTLTDITERKQRETRTERQIELFKELSFIISHQLRHEYVKLHGLVNLIKLNTDKDAQLEKNLSKSLKSFTKVDEYILSLNDKLEKLNLEQ